MTIDDVRKAMLTPIPDYEEVRRATGRRPALPPSSTHPLVLCTHKGEPTCVLMPKARAGITEDFDPQDHVPWPGSIDVEAIHGREARAFLEELERRTGRTGRRSA